MDYLWSQGANGPENTIIQLFETTFTASEGPDEGTTLGNFVRHLMSDTPIADLRLCTAINDAGGIISAAFFSRVTYDAENRTVFILSPMATAPAHQGQGIGQDLIRHAVKNLQAEGVDILLTYGDPAFYGKVGFAPVSTQTAPAPFALTFPEGWIALLPAGGAFPFAPLQGTVSCVSALNTPELW